MEDIWKLTIRCLSHMYYIIKYNTIHIIDKRFATCFVSARSTWLKCKLILIYIDLLHIYSETTITNMHYEWI